MSSACLPGYDSYGIPKNHKVKKIRSAAIEDHRMLKHALGYA